MVQLTVVLVYSIDYIIKINKHTVIDGDSAETVSAMLEKHRWDSLVLWMFE